MLNLLLHRILIALPTLFIVSVIVFLMQKLMPGDPALIFAGDERNPTVLALLRVQYHLNDPLWVQYGYWIGDVLHGDFGHSLRTEVPVLTLIAQKLPVTLQLSATAMVIAILIGIPAGIFAATRKGTGTD